MLTEAYERHCATSARTADNLIATCDRWESMYRDLLAKYHEITRPAVPTLTTASGVIPLQPAEPSEITKVIREQCQTADGRVDHALGRHLRAYARELQREGLNDDQIIGKLVAWQTSEPTDHVAEVAS